MGGQRRRVGEILKLASVQSGDSDLSSAAKRGKFRGLLCFLILDQAQTFSHDFAGVLIAPALNQGRDNGFLPFSQDDIACRHRFTSSFL